MKHLRKDVIWPPQKDVEFVARTKFKGDIKRAENWYKDQKPEATFIFIYSKVAA